MVTEEIEVLLFQFLLNAIMLTLPMLLGVTTQNQI